MELLRVSIRRFRYRRSIFLLGGINLQFTASDKKWQIFLFCLTHKSKAAGGALHGSAIITEAHWRALAVQW